MPEFRNALVIGATGGIGGAMADLLEQRGATVVRLSRRSSPGLELTDEASIAAAADSVASRGSFDLVFIATGVLSPGDAQPEKNLRQLDGDQLTRIMAVNAVGPALVMKHCRELLPRDGRAVMATLSARVGSISDNGLGGWYGYRASKAALNQFMRTTAIEIGRKRREAVVLALHPGTVETRLSEKFTAGRKTFPPDESARRLIEVMENATPAMSGGFFDYAGEPIPF